MPARARARRAGWRIAFGLFAAREDGSPIDARPRPDGSVLLRRRGRRVPLEAETFIAYLTRRPQQLKDLAQRRLVQRLLGQ